MNLPRSHRFHAALFAFAAVALAVAAFVWWHWATVRPNGRVTHGVTFSVKYAKELQLDWQAAFIAALDDIGVRQFRIPVYWDDVEPSDGAYRWDDVDWMLREADARGAHVIMAIGRKVPRWPECHAPGWTKSLTADEANARVLRLLETVVTRYKNEPSVVSWQVENEPLFPFGTCPPPDRAFLKKEIELVRGLDTRPVMVTDSGELSTWIRTGTLGDVLGISMYRLVWNERLGELYWPVSPLYYTERINLLSPVKKRVIVSELQAEPWFRESPLETSLDEHRELMPLSQMMENVRFADRVGVSDVYLWGIEWWYWMRTRGDASYWDAAKGLSWKL